jgi:hypothetical protein
MMTNPVSNQTEILTKPQALVIKLSTPHHKLSYPELSAFRKQLEKNKACIKHKPYTLYKKKVLQYRAIFFGFGLLFLILGVIVHYKTLTLSPTILFGSISTFKTSVCFFCIILTLSAWGFSWWLSAEKETAMRLIHQAKNKLRSAHDRKWLDLGLRSYLAFGKQRRPTLAFRQEYRETCARILEVKEETFHLLEQISSAPEINPKTQENLYNQAMIELTEKLAGIVQSFQNKTHLVNED